MRLFSLFLLLGTLVIQWLEVLPSWKVVALILMIIGVVGVIKHLFLQRAFKSIDALFIIAFSFVLGLLLSTFHASKLIDNRISADEEGKELLIIGTVKGIPTVRDDGIRFLFDIKKASYVKQTTKAIDLKGVVRLGWYQQLQSVKSGDIWQLKVKLKQPSGFMNPGGFDFEKWLFTQRIIATGYVRKSKKIINDADSEKNNSDKRVTSVKTEINTNNENYKISESSLSTMWRSIDRIRQNIHERVQARVDDKPSAAVLSALLVAVRDKLSDQQWQSLQATGTSHLVAISGLHVAVVAGFGFFPIMLLWRFFPRLNERIPVRIAGAIVGTLFAMFYAMLAGFTLPTQRALLMVVIGLWGLVSRRNFASSFVFSMALILVLLYDPLAAMTISFWLSFIAVFLILFFMKRQIEQQRWLAIKLQIFISLAMLPLTALFFGTASLTSPVANLFAIPWVSLIIVPISLMALMIMPFSDFLSDTLLELAAFAIDIFFRFLAILGESPLSQIHLADIPASLLLSAFIGILFLVLPKGFPVKYLGFLLLIPAFIYQPKSMESGDFKYTVLDVGQGYASVLQTKNYLMVYDTGTRISDSFDVGKLVVAPFLRSQGISKINTLLISHEDIDHRGGAQYLLDNFKVDEIISDQNRSNRSKRCETGLKWAWDEVNFEVLSPVKGFIGNDNNRSCVLKVWSDKHSLLLTGDIQKKTERELLLFKSDRLKSDVLGVPHHGSKSSSTQAFLEKVSPKIGLVSAGYRSRFGHPHLTVVDRYQDLGIELFDTIQYGAISLHFSSSDSKINKAFYRIDKKGFWSKLID